MVNYNNGKIYKIINENNEIIYIGSTVQTLYKRWSKHNHKSPINKIILIENYSCNSQEELCKREQEVIDKHSDLLNQIRAYTSEEDLKQYHKEYREKNKEQNKQYRKEYIEINKEKIKEKNKEYYENNKDKINERHKKYRENNKDKFKEQNRQYD